MAPGTDLDAVRRAERIELQRVFTHGQFLVMGRAGDGAVGAGKTPLLLAFPFPDFRRCVGLCHCVNSIPGVVTAISDTI